MKLINEIKEIKTGDRDLKNFAYLIGGLLIFLGVAFYIGKRKIFWFLPGIGIPLSLIGFIRPQLLKWLYIPWMTLAILMGALMSPVILTLLFFLAITPIALLARLTGKKFLELEFKKDLSSYWIPKKQKKNMSHYEIQY